MANKYTYHNLEEVKDLFNKEGYKLVSKKYINTHTNLDYICPKGHKHSISLNAWLYNGNRCPYCSNRIRKDIKDIQKKFKSEGYTLLTKEYINIYTELHYICPRGHRHKTSWNNWQSGRRCPSCAGLAKPDIKDIRKSFEAEGYELLSKEYINKRKKLHFICPKGHKHSIRWDSWKNQKQRCFYCYGTPKNTIEYIREQFETEGYTLFNKEYINNKQRLYYECPEGHLHNTTFIGWLTGNRCKYCYELSKFGEGNPAWKGGISCEPYCIDWTKEYKEYIKERDNYTCQNPYCYGISNKLVIHHINYIKKDCKKENLIALCDSCNGRANKDREWHTAWYRIIMTNKYGYTYDSI